jgi:hypothetical protein
MRVITIAILIVSFGLSGCTGTGLPTTLPLAPSMVATVVTAAASPSTSPTVADPGSPLALVQPTITSVSPNVISTAGSWGTITGTQIQPGASVKIGGIMVASVFRDSTTIQFPSTGVHPAGTVDVTVTNPGGLIASLPLGITFAPVESFDVDGDWIAHTDGRNDYVTDMRFSIRNNALIGLSCGTPVTMSTIVAMQNGKFSFAGLDGLSLTGVLTSSTTSYGFVSAPGCGDGRWWGEKAK